MPTLVPTRRFRRLCLAMAVVLVVSACGDDSSGGGDAPSADDLIGEWHVVEVATDESIESVPTGVDPVLVLEESGDLQVTGLCNTLGSTWELDGDHLSITPPISTLMACEPPELMQTESAIGAALARVDTVTVASGTLTLADESGTTLLVATANPA